MVDGSPTVVIVVAREAERSAIALHLDELRVDPHPAGTRFEVGRLAGTPYRVVLAFTGVGNLPATVLTERAIATYRPIAVVDVGMASAWHPSVAPGDVVVATKVAYYQGGREDDAGHHAHPRTWNVSHKLEQIARHLARSMEWESSQTAAAGRPPRVHFEPIAAGEVVINARDGKTGRIVSRHYADAVAIDLTAAGVAHAGQLNDQLPALALRGIGDRVDDTGNVDYERDDWPAQVARNVAIFTVAILTELARSPDADPAGDDATAGRRRRRRGRRRRLIGAGVLAVVLGLVYGVKWLGLVVLYEGMGADIGDIPGTGTRILIDVVVQGVAVALVLVVIGGAWTIAQLIQMWKVEPAALTAKAAAVTTTLSSIFLTGLLLMTRTVYYSDLANMIVFLSVGFAWALWFSNEFAALDRLVGVRTKAGFIGGGLAGLGSVTAVVTLTRIVPVVREHRVWFLLAGFALVTAGSVWWLRVALRRSGTKPVAETSPAALIDRLRAAARLPNLRESMPGGDAALRLGTLVVLPTVLIVLLVAVLPSWLLDRDSDGGAVLRYGYLPDDRIAAFVPTPPLRLVTFRLRGTAVDAHQICAEPVRWAATLLGEDDTSYHVLLRPIGAEPESAEREPAQVVRLPKDAYELRPVPERDLPRDGEPWTGPACEAS